MRICLMIEGQEGVEWEHWLALARAAEDAGLDGLFRSDHYRSIGRGDPAGSLDAWTTLSALASGSLVLDRSEAVVWANPEAHAWGLLREGRLAVRWLGCSIGAIMQFHGRQRHGRGRGHFHRRRLHQRRRAHGMGFHGRRG